MAESDPLTLSVPILNSKKMGGKSTPAVQNWTYHHVLPVRYYYLAASVLLRVAALAEDDAARSVQQTTLAGMAKTTAQQAEIGDLMGRVRNGETFTDAEFQAAARHCGAPAFGGFPGPDGSTRPFDPGSTVEPVRPRSARTDWWDALRSIKQLLDAAFSITAPPAAGTSLSATLTEGQWRKLAANLTTAIHTAAAAGAPTFDWADWRPVQDGPWARLRFDHATTPATPVEMRLLREGETSNYLGGFVDAKDDPMPARASGVILVARGRSQDSNKVYAAAIPAVWG